MYCENDLSISKFSKKYSISTQKLIGFLIEKDKIFLDENSLLCNEDFIYKIMKGKQSILKVKESLLSQFLKNDIDSLRLLDEETKNISLITNTQILQNKLHEISMKKLLFIDFEFSKNNYNEVHFITMEKQKVIGDGYFFLNNDTSKKEEILSKQHVDFSKTNLQDMNKMILDLANNADYIVSHNAFSDRAILVKNNIFIKKQKFICTSDIFKKLNNADKEHSLESCLNHFNIKHNNNFSHFAFHDNTMTKKLFFKLINSH